MVLESQNSDTLIKNLAAVGIAQLSEWDVLVFIRNRGASLASADRIASLLGHSTDAVRSALDKLTSAGLIQRSRSSGGARLYQLAPAVAGDDRQRSLKELIQMAADSRQGRMLLMGHLRRAADGKQLRGRSGLHLA
jgi:DNA-binding MarR family transcriptional regulator